MKTFNEWLEENHPEYLDESWGRAGMMATLGTAAALGLTGCQGGRCDTPVQQPTAAVQQESGFQKYEAGILKGNFIKDEGDHWLVGGAAKVRGLGGVEGAEVAYANAENQVKEIIANKLGRTPPPVVAKKWKNGNTVFVLYRVPLNAGPRMAPAAPGNNVKGKKDIQDDQWTSPAAKKFIR